ncbi:MAG: nucleotidyltransferase domain-containing protein [Spirochaetota bacterium]
MEEEKTIQLFKEEILSRFSDKVSAILLYGSKARGDYGKESDIDILVVISAGDWRIADQIRTIGYELDEGIDYKFSIQVLPENRIKYMREHRFQFIEKG